jgi:hypothetical protein
MSRKLAKQKMFWIKERDNPQLGTYFILCGQLSKAVAKGMENPLYGSNIMRSYPDEAAYEKEIKKLKEEGASIQ